MTRRTRAWLPWLLAGVPAIAGAVEFATLSENEPRAFGYSVGDLVPRVVSVHVPEGLQLDADSVPLPGRRGKAIELASVRWTRHAEAGGQRHELRLEYQVFHSPPEVRTLELPAFELRVAGAGGAQALRVEAWPVTVAPLVPADVSPRHGLGELRPDAPPPLIDTRAGLQRLGVYGGLSLLLLAYLAHVYIALPWWARQRRPFTRAWRDLRVIAQRRAAYQRVHEALNSSAGEVLFAADLDAFLRRRPQLAPLREDLQRFFQRSSQTFFAGGAAGESEDLAWLVALCRRASRLERGVA